MKKKTIWTIAVIMGLSFLALLFLQLKYIEEMAEMKHKKATLLRVGLNDEYSIRVGNQKYLRGQYGIDAKSIAEKIWKALD